MKIYNETKTNVLENVDLEKGHLVTDKLLISHSDAVEPNTVYFEKHYYDKDGNLIGTSKNIDVEKSTPYIPEKNEYEDIQVYIPYTQKELAEKRIYELKANLSKTDYVAIKFMEGVITELELRPMKEQRQAWRDEINRLEEEMKK